MSESFIKQFGRNKGPVAEVSLGEALSGVAPANNHQRESWIEALNLCIEEMDPWLTAAWEQAEKNLGHYFGPPSGKRQMLHPDSVVRRNCGCSGNFGCSDCAGLFLEASEESARCFEQLEWRQKLIERLEALLRGIPI